ncbi:haloacid dehalogenase-like hydrolase [Veillonella denticariosi]|uniref:haloacid dehalogenase-like hydrolase n=1 Tax=Veillonella denticariosi TaxID=419208 RepID=UPI0024929034|nr:haloacid dehalogenase-like hydrolase [Veillonella denticariosi]
MSNIIAVIWDCDKTLIDGYMQDPIFKKFGVDATQFWDENNKRQTELQKRYPNMRINSDTYYLNLFLQYIREGKFVGLNNELLREFGNQQQFYKNVPEFLSTLNGLFQNDMEYREYGIQVENYIVSTGFAEVIRGSTLNNVVKEIWGCELIESNTDGNDTLSDVVYTIDNTTKTRALFEINKGSWNKSLHIDVNSKITLDTRRVPFENMIYIADGPSDIPAFSLIKEKGGTTFAIYPRGDMKALNQVEQMRMDGRVDMYAEADYSEGTTANLWIRNKISEIANRIRAQERSKLLDSVSSVPRHLV